MNINYKSKYMEKLNNTINNINNSIEQINKLKNEYSDDILNNTMAYLKIEDIYNNTLKNFISSPIILLNNSYKYYDAYYIDESIIPIGYYVSLLNVSFDNKTSFQILNAITIIFFKNNKKREFQMTLKNTPKMLIAAYSRIINNYIINISIITIINNKSKLKIKGHV